MGDLECPYCEHEQDINHDDGFGYAEGVKHQMDCYKCGKTFVFETSISFYYEPEKADCLNGSEHEYRLNSAFPNCFSTMQCSACGDIRNLTDDERKIYNIESEEEYIKSISQ